MTDPIKFAPTGRTTSRGEPMYEEALTDLEDVLIEAIGYGPGLGESGTAYPIDIAARVMEALDSHYLVVPKEPRNDGLTR